MRKCLFSLLFAMALLSSLGFAELNITSNPVTLGAQSNLSSNATMLNLTFSLTDNTTVNITSINFTFSSTTSGLAGNQTNLSVCVYNSSISPANTIGCNSAWDGSITAISIGYDISNETQANFIVVYEIFYNATYPMDIGINISSNTSIALDNASIFINSSFPIASNHTTVRVVQATASILPHYADTNVTNQTFRYFAYSTTGDLFNKINITIPSGFANVNVTSYNITRYDDSPAYFGSCIDSCSVSGNSIVITNSTGMKNITIYFNATTNASAQNSTSFSSTIDGTNVQDINTNFTAGATNVTIMNLLNVTNIAVVKNSAIVNGTDYWEFNFTVNVSASINGTLQFRMSEWNSSSAGRLMNLTNSTTGSIGYYATFRENNIFNTTNKVNITSFYNGTQGVLVNATANNAYNFILRMVIPSGTPIASDWWTTYSMLFRAAP